MFRYDLSLPVHGHFLISCLFLDIYLRVGAVISSNFRIPPDGFHTKTWFNGFICCIARCHIQQSGYVSRIPWRPRWSVISISRIYMYRKNIFSIFRFPAIHFEIKTALVLVIVVILFHIMDRQIEFTSRTDFLWKAKLKVEQEEVETMRGINKVKIYIFLFICITFRLS